MANEKKITRIKKRSTGTEYIPYPQDFQSALDSANAAAAQANNAVVAAQTIVSGTQQLIGGHLIPMFDSGTSYRQYDLVLYQPAGATQPILYKALEAVSPGPWDSTQWQQTSYYQELIDTVGVETVKVSFKKLSDLSALSGITVTVSIGGTNHNYTTDTQGVIVFTVPYGNTYTIIPPAVSGYNTPLSVSRVANNNTRFITVTYSAASTYTNLSVIMSDGTEIPFSGFDGDITEAVLLKLISSVGNCTIAIHNSHPSYAWSNKSIQFPSLPYLNSSQATSDYDGVHNSELIEADRLTLLASYPDLTIPAVNYCRSQSVTINGVTKTGYLPAAGQLVLLKNNVIDVNVALTALGGNTIGLGSGDWWSSSQFSVTYAWFLGYGSLNDSYRKTYSFQVLPFFDF